jgi:anthranilate/para-aminobenzoate synthase component II
MQPYHVKPTYSYINVVVMQWLQASGLELVFIPSTVSAAEAAAYFEHIHGLFLHPGWPDDPKYMSLTQAFIRMGLEANRVGDYFPIWGTCMGMQMLMMHFGGKLERIYGRKFRVGTTLELRRTESRLLAAAPLKRDYVPHFNNNYGITTDAFSGY